MAFTKPCVYCNDPKPEVNLEKINNKWIATNLDGSPHKHNAAYKTEWPKPTQGQAMRRAYPDTAPLTTDLSDDEGRDDKLNAAPAESNPKKTMEQMHDENVAAWNAQTDAIKQLSLDVGMLTAAITRHTQRQEMDALAKSVPNKEPGWNE